jgi:hypothetical protein
LRETAADLARLQALLDQSYEHAGQHLKAIITPERRLTAAALVARLEGMCLLVLATTTADARPITGPVDGFFYRGSWYFGSSDLSLRFRHIRRRPAVSVAYVPAEELGVTTHGRAYPIDVTTHDGGGLRRVLVDYYEGRYGEWGATIVEEPGVSYARVEAERMYTFHLDPRAGA